jgi:sigma-B regulation protein RsbU (phosphoserine phosphatase)
VDPIRPNGSYWLIGLEGNLRELRLSADAPLLVGRGVHNHLVLNDYRISRQHARVAPERDGFVVYDLNSANGTFVNGTAVRRQALRPDDEVTFGPFAFRLEFHADQILGNSPATPANPVKWRASESITRFNQKVPTRPNPAKTAPLGSVAVAAREPQPLPRSPSSHDWSAPPPSPGGRPHTRDTIPPEGHGSLPIDEQYDDTGGDIEPPVSLRESSKFRTEAATVDLNQLEDAYEKLGTLYAFMQAISKTIDRRELVALIAGKVLELYPAARAVGLYMRGRTIRAKDRGDGSPFQLVHFLGDEAARGARVLPSAATRALLAARRAIFSHDAPEGKTTGSTMYAPLIDTADALGVIYVASDPRRESFTIRDLELLNGMAAPAAIMMQNTRMHEESLQRERLNRDLELAAQIQKSFLPREVLSVPGVEFLATYKAAYTVGGDFYDVFWVGPDLLAVFIGDISGKGVAAALLMARISGELRVAALAHVDPVAVLTIMNKAVIGRGQPELFFTAIYFTLNVKTGEVVLATAGHNSPYLCHADGSVDIITDGASGAVGMLEDPSFAATRLFLTNGDSLVLYTDGVVEASDGGGALYGDERLAMCLAGAGTRPQEIADSILRSVEQHVQGSPANDDLTIFICHRREGLPPSLQPRRQSGMTDQVRVPIPPPPVTVRR